MRKKQIIAIALAGCVMAGISSTPAYFVGHGPGMTVFANSVIAQAKSDWAAANARGDKAGMAAAHSRAEAERAKSGYSGGSDGSQRIPVNSGGSGGSSSYGGSSGGGNAYSNSSGNNYAPSQPQVSSQSQAVIDKAKADYEAAKARGDNAGMNAAHAVAQAERMKNGFISNPNGTGSVSMPKLTNDQISTLQNSIASGGKLSIVDIAGGGKQIQVEIPGVSKDMSKMTAEEKNTYIAGLKKDGTLQDTMMKGGVSQKLNMDIFLKYGVISYGDPNSVTSANPSKNNPNFKNGEPRYLGYDANGNLIENDRFPRDSDSGKAAELKAWKTVFEIQRDKEAMRLAGITSGYVCQKENAEKTAKLFLEQNPQWVAQGYTVDRLVNSAVFKSYADPNGVIQGQFVMVHTNAYGTWYQSFNVKPGAVPIGEKYTITITPPGDNPPSYSGGPSGGSGTITPERIINASVTATDKLKSGYGITASVTVTGNVPITKVIATVPDGATYNMVTLADSSWAFPANTGKAAEAYNRKFNTVSRQVFVPVMFPDKTDYIISYALYDASGNIAKTLRSYTYIDGNMYEDDHTVTSKERK